MSNLSNPWPELDFWQSEDWVKAQAKLDNMERFNVRYNPIRSDLFRVLRMVRMDHVQVIIVGSEPYKGRRFATGTAFAVPKTTDMDDFPSALRGIFKELSTDLRCEVPCTGDLSGWAKKGVLLWNSNPVVISGKPLSCRWDEWITLSREIITRCDRQGVVVLVGARARQFAQYCTGAIEFPAPTSKSFIGCRFFTTINAELIRKGKSPIDWRIDASNGSPRPENIQRSNMVGGRVLENLTGIVL